MNDLARGSEKPSQREIAEVGYGGNLCCMKTNQFGDDAEPVTVAYSRDATVESADQGLEINPAGPNRVFWVGNSPGRAVATAIASRRPFPLRTLMVCFTVWLIATQAMIFDQIKFEERAHLLEQAAQSFGAPQVIVPNGQPSNLSTGAYVQRL